MNVLRSGLVTMLLLAAFSVQAACTWPAWEQFKKDYISQEGRVIDPSDARKITTSEGQSYGMFFALAANDRAAFDNLLDWTQNNLAQGSLKEHLPAWLWGKKENSKWEVLDSNSASDGDVWMAWSLLEAGRLWKEQRYTDIGSALLKRIAREEVVTVPGLGSMLLPGKVGFAEDNSWRFNPSYLPPTLAQYFTRFGAPWTTLRETNQRLLLETAPKGFSPDWVRYEKDKGWQLKAEKTLISSYDAIRVYMWVGMMPDSDPQKARMLNRFKPMATFTEKNGYPPEKVDVATGKAQGKGPVGFSAAMLPFLQNRDAQAVQRQRVADNFPGSDAYYNYVLTLFGQGWVNIEDVPDVVFAEKIVGDGIAIKPTGNKMVAPVDGTIGKIFETNHAFSIESDSGVELFVHFGIDTVELKGEGFKRIAEEGQRVKVGDTVIEFDLPLLEEKAKSTLTPVVISNMDEIKELIKLSGSVTVGETPVIRIKK